MVYDMTCVRVCLCVCAYFYTHTHTGPSSLSALEACYKDLPLGLKIYVTILLLLAMRGGVRMISENPSMSYANAGKCLFVLAVGTQVLITLYS